METVWGVYLWHRCALCLFNNGFSLFEKGCNEDNDFSNYKSKQARNQSNGKRREAELTTDRYLPLRWQNFQLTNEDFVFELTKILMNKRNFKEKLLLCARKKTDTSVRGKGKVNLKTAGKKNFFSAQTTACCKKCCFRSCLVSFLRCTSECSLD